MSSAPAADPANSNNAVLNTIPALDTQEYTDAFFDPGRNVVNKKKAHVDLPASHLRAIAKYIRNSKEMGGKISNPLFVALLRELDFDNGRYTAQQQKALRERLQDAIPAMFRSMEKSGALRVDRLPYTEIRDGKLEWALTREGLFAKKLDIRSVEFARWVLLPGWNGDIQRPAAWDGAYCYDEDEKLAVGRYEEGEGEEDGEDDELEWQRAQ
ncbi:hypothetical protein B0J14DRAFT_656036 [Halenospora varia]|nr:hypothetical protein B0J14DRAFT_656036 [Halenospora varia]